MSKAIATKEKENYKITNWPSYNQALKARGSVTIWMSEDALKSWEYNGERKPGGKVIYSDLAIETCLVVRKVYHLKLRQTEGFVQSLFSLMRVGNSVPDYSTMSRGAKRLDISLGYFGKGEAIDIVVDSTGLKVYGEGEWKVRKYGWSKRRTWRKLHIGVNPVTHELVAEILTENDIDDAQVVAPLLEGATVAIKSFRGDGAYDKQKVRKLLTTQEIEQIIPPQNNAVVSKKARSELLARDKAIKRIKQVGRKQWKKETGYHKRSIAEVAMYRYKTILGDKILAKIFENQQAEVRIGCKILNIMTKLGLPISRMAA